MCVVVLCMSSGQLEYIWSIHDGFVFAMCLVGVSLCCTSLFVSKCCVKLFLSVCMLYFVLCVLLCKVSILSSISTIVFLFSVSAVVHLSSSRLCRLYWCVVLCVVSVRCGCVHGRFH